MFSQDLLITYDVIHENVKEIQKFSMKIPRNVHALISELVLGIALEADVERFTAVNG